MLRQQVFEQDRRNVNTDSDSEVLLNVFAYELEQQRQLSPEAAIRGGRRAPPLQGAMRWSAWCWAWAWSPSATRMASVRWCWASAAMPRATSTSASESAALDVLGFQRVRDVQPGEALVITARGELFSEICAEPAEHTPCIFEYVYFARPDSMIDNVSVHKARMRMGIKLGEDPAPAPGS